ncbi:MAG: hypothetical protein K1X75_00090 [Leptospirales bacterium]|nr:hypothetical protein [Leptospirales bacterium]
MQNVDFSPRLRRASSIRSLPEAPAAPSSALDLRRSNRSIVALAAGGILIFTLGLVAGIQIGRLKNLDETVVRYPDGRRNSAPPPHATPAPERSAPQPAAVNDRPGGAQSVLANQPEAGRFIIKLGSFRSSEAARLSDRLNAIAGLESVATTPCRGVQEPARQRGAAFRVGAAGRRELENVFAGCFRSAATAQAALEQIQRSGVPGASRARVYEIE